MLSNIWSAENIVSSDIKNFTPILIVLTCNLLYVKFKIQFSIILPEFL